MRSRARESQILTDDTVRGIVATALAYDKDGDVGRMVLMLAATGARFSQLQRVTVDGVQIDQSRVFVPASWKGQGKPENSYPVQDGSDVIDALRPVLAGSTRNEPFLCRWRMKQTKQLKWERDYWGTWMLAAEMPLQRHAICASLGLKGVVPYALRHSSNRAGNSSGVADPAGSRVKGHDRNAGDDRLLRDHYKDGPHARR